MFWAYIILSQTAAPPQTGNPTLDMMLYLLGGLVSLLGIREGTWWVKQLRARKKDSQPNPSSEIMWRIAQIQKETLKELDEMRREGREAHTRIEATLTEVLRNQRGV